MEQLADLEHFYSPFPLAETGAASPKAPSTTAAAFPADEADSSINKTAGWAHQSATQNRHGGRRYADGATRFFRGGSPPPPRGFPRSDDCATVVCVRFRLRPHRDTLVSRAFVRWQEPCSRIFGLRHEQGRSISRGSPGHLTTDPCPAAPADADQRDSYRAGSGGRDLNIAQRWNSAWTRATAAQCAGPQQGGIGQSEDRQPRGAAAAAQSTSGKEALNLPCRYRSCIVKHSRQANARLMGTCLSIERPAAIRTLSLCNVPVGTVLAYGTSRA
jgi:hypothetical protein